MGKRLASALKTTLRQIGFYRRILEQRVFPGVAVLCYHGVRSAKKVRGPMTFPGLHVTPDELRQHLRLLAETCDLLSLETFRSLLDPGARGQARPPRPVLVTFDDGYRSVLTEAAPLLRRFGVPAAVFVTTGPVLGGELFWFDAVARQRGERAVEEAKSLPYAAWKRLAAEHQTRAEPEDPNAPLSPEELRQLAAEPTIEIGGHTVDHPILAHASEAQQRDEIRRNREHLATLLGGAPRAFAYPNGRPGLNFTAQTEAVVEAVGYEDAFSTEHGFARGDASSRSNHRRFLMLAGISGAELAHRLAFSWLPQPRPPRYRQPQPRLPRAGAQGR